MPPASSTSVGYYSSVKSAGTSTTPQAKSFGVTFDEAARELGRLLRVAG
jgi:hypothetical protein